MKCFSLTKLTSLLTALIAASASSTIVAADLPLVYVLATDPTALEGASTGAFTLIRSQGTNADLAVNYVVKGTASNGVDYVLLPGTATIPAGFLAADILVQPMIDPMNRGNKTVILSLQTNLAYGLGDRRSATVTIVDDIFNNLPPVVNLVHPTNGSVFSAPANITVEAEASDPDDAVQSVSFYANDHFLGRDERAPFSLVWSNVPPGEYTLFARAVDPFERSTLSSPVHIRVVQTNRPPVVNIVTPRNGAVFGLPANVDVLAEASDPDDAVVQVKIYGDERLLGTFASGPYSLTWSNVPPGRHIIVARATDAVGLVTYAKAEFSVSNAAPRVVLTAPVEGANFPLMSNIKLEAEAADPDGAIQRVTFLANERVLGVANTAPYSIVWSNVPPGEYTLFARAVDRFERSTLSSPVHIRVVQTNRPPVVNIVTPQNGTAFGLPANIDVLAEASDPDDAVVQVKIYGDERLLGTFASGPYSLTWSNVPPGRHIIVARATDAVGLVTYAKAEFSVSNAAPRVVLTAPVEGANFPPMSNIKLEAEAADPDGAIQRVTFLANERVLGVANTAPYSIVWSNAPLGRFKLAAVATDQYGARATSKPVLISVGGPLN